jgi:hypothetical protein
VTELRFEIGANFDESIAFRPVRSVSACVAGVLEGFDRILVVFDAVFSRFCFFFFFWSEF